jgi:hypothetical protein
MDEKYIFEGPALQKVIKENRIRIARGELIVTPLVDAAPEVEDTKVEDTKVPEVEDTKVVAPADEKKPKNGKK